MEAVLDLTVPGGAFPLLTPTAPDLSAWAGHLVVHDASGTAREFALELSGLPGLGGALPKPPLAAASLRPGRPLADLLGAEALATLGARLRASPDVAAFLTELRESAASALAARATPPAPPPAFYGALAAQLEALPAGCVATVEPSDTTCLTLTVAVHQRRHALRLRLPPGFPAAPPQADSPPDLPLSLPPLRPGVTLAECAGAIAVAAERCFWLWAALEAVDAVAWPVEPPVPAPLAATHRRLALGGAAALWVSLDAAWDPATPMPPPALRVYGPEAGAAPRRAALAAALAAWQPPEPAAAASGAWLPAWLEAALQEGPLPRKPQADAAPSDLVPPECGICYCFARPLPEGAPEGAVGEAPSVGCDNPRCGQPYHTACLAEWLHAESKAVSFGTLFGECAYCGSPIAVKPDT